MFIVLCLCLLYLLMIHVIQSYVIYGSKIHKKSKNVNMAKRAMFATFAISIKDQLCLLQQYKWNTIKIRLPRLIIKVPYKSTFMTIRDFFISP